MRYRRFKKARLAHRVVAGYRSGFASLAHCRQWREHHRQQIMNEVARTCVDAARTGNPNAVPVTPPPPSHAGWWR
jgi:hypothetical protein